MSFYDSTQTASCSAHVVTLSCLVWIEPAALQKSLTTWSHVHFFVYALVQKQKPKRGLYHEAVLGSSGQVFKCTAESERAAVRKHLEATRDQLVQNYVQEQQKLYSELIPEVSAVLLPGAECSKVIACFQCNYGSGWLYAIAW